MSWLSLRPLLCPKLGGRYAESYWRQDDKKLSQSCYSSPGPVTSLCDDRVAMMAAPGDLVQWVMVSLPPGSKTASRCRYTA
ncbi:hypothetical protein TYRP_019390, partial [Tyrophagus putrescentiae]